MKLKLIEPLKEMFKDEVRLLGKSIGLKKDMFGRHPFPGPGLAIRIIGKISTCLLRAVTSEDGMTADYFGFSKEFLDGISNKIINRVKGINRVVYDITSKPPGTIELE